MRQPLYGLLVGNCLMVAMGLILRLYGSVAALPGYQPDLQFLDQMGALMVWGTLLLFIDCIALILIYEKLGQRVARTVTARIFRDQFGAGPVVRPIMFFADALSRRHSDQRACGADGSPSSAPRWSTALPR